MLEILRRFALGVGAGLTAQAMLGLWRWLRAPVTAGTGGADGRVPPAAPEEAGGGHPP